VSPYLPHGEEREIVTVGSDVFDKLLAKITTETQLHWQVVALDGRDCEIVSSKRYPFTLLPKEEIPSTGSTLDALLCEVYAARAQHEEKEGCFDEALNTLASIPDSAYRERATYAALVKRWRHLDNEEKRLSKEVNSGDALEEIRLAKQALKPLLADHTQRLQQPTQGQESKRRKRQ
jgi:hypothetical protein